MANNNNDNKENPIFEIWVILNINNFKYSFKYWISNYQLSYRCYYRSCKRLIKDCLILLISSTLLSII